MGLFLAVILVALASYFLLHKKKIVAQPADEKLFVAYKTLLNTHITYYQKLTDGDKVRFEKLITEFLSYVRIEGVGTAITDLDRVMVASGAVIPIFGFPDWKYNNLTNVIIYPDTFDNNFQFEGENRNIMGMVGSGYMNGQMLLSRDALVRGFSKSGDKENTAIHEFVHLLDKADGATDGIPENLLAHEYAMPWLKMIHQEMQKIEEGRSDINPYALTNEAEFFAVAAEYFFEKPEQLQHQHPEIYEHLSQIFGQKPAA